MDNKKKTTEIDRVIGALIKSARKEKGMSQEQLAQQIGITFQQVQKYENGHNRLPVTRLIDIARATDKEVSYFVDNALLKAFEDHSLAESFADDRDIDPRLYFRIISGLSRIRDEQVLLAIIDVIERFSAIGSSNTRH